MPITRLAHKWVAMEMTPVEVFRRTNGEVIAIPDPDAKTQIQLGCSLCDASPESGWSRVCPGADE